jgi:hypothetical protein
MFLTIKLAVCERASPVKKETMEILKGNYNNLYVTIPPNKIFSSLVSKSTALKRSLK